MDGKEASPVEVPQEPQCDPPGVGSGESTPPKRPSILQRGIDAIAQQQASLRSPKVQSLVSYLVVCVIVGIDIGGNAVVVPLVPFYVEHFKDSEKLGFGTANALVTSSYAIAQMIAVPIFGIASDRFGRRPLLLLSPLGGALGFLGQGFAGTLWQFCAFRFVTGLFSGTRPVALAYIGDTVPPTDQPQYMSGITCVVSCSLFFAPVIGGAFGLVSLQLPCFVMAGLCMLVVFVGWFHVAEPDRKAKGAASTRGGQAAGTSASGTSASGEKPPRWKGWATLNALAGGACMFHVSSWLTLFPMRATQLHDLDQNSVGLILGSSGLFIGVAQFLGFVPLSRRLALPFIAMIGTCVTSSAAWLPLISDKTGLDIASCFLNACGMGFFMPCISITLNMLAPATRRGLAMSLTITLQSLARVFGPMTAGPLYDWEPWAPQILMGCVCLVALLCQLALTAKIKPLGQKPKPGDAVRQDVEGGTASAELRRAQWNAAMVREELCQRAAAVRRWSCELSDEEALETARDEATDAPHASPPITQEQKHRIGEWLSDMLVAHNYHDWPAQEDNVKLVFRNAFPPIRSSPESARLEDICYVLESQMLLGDRWEDEQFHLDMNSTTMFG